MKRVWELAFRGSKAVWEEGGRPLRAGLEGERKGLEETAPERRGGWGGPRGPQQRKGRPERSLPGPVSLPGGLGRKRS